MKKPIIIYAFILLILAFSFSSLVYASQQYDDREKKKAKETLINFFMYLHDGRFKEAVPLFEPWENAEGEQRSSWEGLASFSNLEDRGEKAKVLSNYCKAVGTCLNVDVINIEKIAKGTYKLRVQFFKDNGSVYTLQLHKFLIKSAVLRAQNGLLIG